MKSLSIKMRIIIITEGGGSNLCGRAPKGPPPNLFLHRRRLANFFWGPPSDD
nr:MAG TPA: hypothetical protein [Caudoviricetes sp.]